MTIYADPAVRPDRAPDDEDADTPPRRNRDPLWAKLCLILGALVMVTSGAVVVVPKIVAAWFTSDIKQEDLLPPGIRGENINGPINILLLGMDERVGTGNAILTDTIMIAHIPASHDTVYLISIPRDSKVDIPPFPETGYRGGSDKINAAFGYGNQIDGKSDPSTAGRQRGVALMAHTIGNLVPGMKFNAVAIINFVGFREILNAIGGVYLCVDELTTSVHYDKNNRYHTNEILNISQRKTYEVGCRNFAGWEALDFARQRKSVAGGDYGRQRHQQQLLMAIFTKLLSKGVLTDIGKLTALQKVAGDLFTLDLGGQAIENWAFTLRLIRSENVTLIKTNAGKPNSRNINGTSYEILTQDTLDLLRAVQDDTVHQFLSTHPDWISKK